MLADINTSFDQNSRFEREKTGKNSLYNLLSPSVSINRISNQGRASVSKNRIPNPGRASVSKNKISNPGIASVSKNRISNPGRASVSKNRISNPGIAGSQITTALSGFAHVQGEAGKESRALLKFLSSYFTVYCLCLLVPQVFISNKRDFSYEIWNKFLEVSQY